jgi:hypothetical protein
MHVVSLDIKKALNITIRNQYPGLELTSPVYSSNGTTCYVSPSRQTDDGNTIEASFGIDSKQKDFKCALLYKLQRKHATKTDSQPNTSMASIEDTATGMYFLIAWDVEDNNHKSCVCLIDCDDDFAWDEDKLWALYRRYNDQFYTSYKSDIITWLMYDGSAVKTRLDATYGSDYKLDIVISEGTREDDVKEPMKIDPKRLVLPLSIMIVLIHDC